MDRLKRRRLKGIRRMETKDLLSDVLLRHVNLLFSQTNRRAGN